MKQEIDIDQLMAETWLIVTLLKKGATTLNGSALYDKCVKQVENARQVLKSAGYDEASIEHISYAQCALLDEAVMSRTSVGQDEDDSSQIDEGQIAWRKAPLQARFFGSLHAGEELWERIAEVLCQPAPAKAVLICYHRVITLGFHGLYSLQTVSQTQRDAVIGTLAKRVPPLDSGLSLIIHPTRRHRYSLMRSVWFWTALAAVVTGSVWWGGHLWLEALLTSQLAELPH